MYLYCIVKYRKNTIKYRKKVKIRASPRSSVGRAPGC